MRRAVATINQAALQHNLECVRQLAPQSQIMAVVKANGYGHGVQNVVAALEAADAFATATVTEAITLQKYSEKQIVVLEGGYDVAEFLLAAQQNIAVVVHCEDQLRQLAQCRFLQPLRIWLKCDTGMHRLGFLPHRCQQVWSQLQKSSVIELVGIMTHFANADLPADSDTQIQIDTLLQLSVTTSPVMSMANSAAILAWNCSHADWVRPGIMLYGISPFTDKTGEELGLQPVMTLTAPIIAINQHCKGSALGYGSIWSCPEDMPIGVVAIGYGDGYPRHVNTDAVVWYNDSILPVVGRVSMDMLMVDLRMVPEIEVGDRVELWGEHIAIEVVANWAGTIAYELTCQLTERVEKIVV